MTNPAPAADPAATDSTTTGDAAESTAELGPDANATTDQPDAEHQYDDQAAVDDQADDATIGREAARYRARLRQTESELAEAKETHAAELAAQRLLTATQRDAVIGATVKAAGVDPRILEAAGVDQDDLLDDRGCVDAEKVSAAISKALKDLGVASTVHRRPAPVKQQGAASGPGGHAPTLGSMLKDAAHGQATRTRR